MESNIALKEDGDTMDETMRQSDWVLVEDGGMKGANIIMDNVTNEVVQLSTKDCKDEDRWTEMPSLEAYPFLEYVSLDNSRYIREVHESLTGLTKLRKLALTRCLSLERLPSSLGKLENLREVRYYLGFESWVRMRFAGGNGLPFFLTLFFYFSSAVLDGLAKHL